MQGGRCLLVQALNSAAGLGSGSNPGRGGEGKGTSPETCSPRFAPTLWAKVGLCQWKWQWGLWGTHAGTSREGQRPVGPCQGFKGPKMPSGAPGQWPVHAGAGLCGSAVPAASGRYGEWLGARLRWSHPWLSPPPGAQVLGFPGQSRLQTCACLAGGTLQPGEPGGCRHGAVGAGVSPLPCVSLSLLWALPGSCRQKKHHFLQPQEMQHEAERGNGETMSSGLWGEPR